MKVESFRLLTAHVKCYQICTLIGSFCWKYIKFQLKKYRGIISYDTEEWRKIWRKTDLLFQKWLEFSEFWSKHSKVWKTCSLIGPFRTKYITFDLKKVQRSYFSWYSSVMQDLKKNWLVVWKWHEGFSKFLPEHSKVSKLELWWDPFIKSRKCMRLKFTMELCVMTMKNDVKFEEELTCQFKINMRNLTNFDQSTPKSQKIPL